MPATYEPIASRTLSSPATTITFSSIPTTFTDLVVVARYEYDYDAQAWMTLNGSGGGVYSTTQLIGTGTTSPGLLSARTSGTTQWQLEYSASDYMIQTITTVHINNYSNTNMFKTGICLTGSAGGEASRFSMLWRDTSAVSSLTMGRTIGGQYVTGSTFALYGIKAA